MTLLTADDVAAQLRFKPSTVRAMLAANQIPHIRIGPNGGRRRVRQEDLDRWIESQARIQNQNSSKASSTSTSDVLQFPELSKRGFKSA